MFSLTDLVGSVEGVLNPNRVDEFLDRRWLRFKLCMGVCLRGMMCVEVGMSSPLGELVPVLVSGWKARHEIVSGKRGEGNLRELRNR